MKWLLLVFYLLIGPIMVLGNLPDGREAGVAAVVSFFSGVGVAWVHLRQTSFKGQMLVLVGTFLSTVAAAGLWVMGLLALAFAGDSGQHARELDLALKVWSLLVLLIGPFVGAIAGGLIARKLADRSAAAPR